MGYGPWRHEQWDMTEWLAQQKCIKQQEQDRGNDERRSERDGGGRGRSRERRAPNQETV